MSKFKVGDWVRDMLDDGRLYRYSKALEAVTDKCDLELWQPQVGEWCWFKLETRHIPVFERFGSNFYHWNKDDIRIIEPFIGTLPSFLQKDIKDK